MTDHDTSAGVAGETAASALLGWPDGLTGSLTNRGLPWPYDYPTGRPDRLSVSAPSASPACRDVPLSGRWIPDAFAGPMAALQRAVAAGTEPENSGRDNLRTLAIVEAAYRSARERRAVPVADAL